jgi:hypothetical protein
MRARARDTASFRMGAVWGALTLGARAAIYRQAQPAQRRRQGQRAGGPLAGPLPEVMNRRGGGASAAALPRRVSACRDAPRGWDAAARSEDSDAVRSRAATRAGAICARDAVKEGV